MDKYVYKYLVEMPAGAKIMTVQAQHGEPKIWALVDPNAPVETRVFRVAGTGHTVAHNMWY